MRLNDHLVCFTLSAAVHLAGLLLLGVAANRPPDETADTVPELLIASVQLTLSEAEPAAPGAVAAPAQPEAPPLAMPEPEPAPPTPGPSVESSEAAGDGGAAGHVDAWPSLDRPIRPVYPLGARRRGEEGTVVLDVKVAADGRASGVTLVRSSGFAELDRSAERAAAQARFNPATRGGHPVESAARLTLVFRLRDL